MAAQERYEEVRRFVKEFNAFLVSEGVTEFEEPYQADETTETVMTLFSEWKDGLRVADNPRAKEVAQAWEE